MDEIEKNYVKESLQMKKEKSDDKKNKIMRAL